MIQNSCHEMTKGVRQNRVLAIKHRCSVFFIHCFIQANSFPMYGLFYSSKANSFPNVFIVLFKQTVSQVRSFQVQSFVLLRPGVALHGANYTTR